MATDKTKKYMNELKAAIKERTGEDCPSWMLPAVRSAAMQMQILDNIQEALLDSPLSAYEVGSQGQQRNVAHPLLTAYKEGQRTLNTQLTSLGLTFDATPSKLTESTKKGIDDSDPMQRWANALK